MTENGRCSVIGCALVLKLYLITCGYFIRYAVIVGVSHTIAVVEDTEFSWLNFFKNAGIPDDDAVQ